MSPYRKMDAIVKSKDNRPFYGLLRAEPEHKCNPPGMLKRLLHHLFGMTIHYGSVFRCTCNQTFALRRNYGERIGTWREVHDQEWWKLGGQTEIKGQKE